MAIDFRTFGKVVPHIAKVKKPVMIRGKHGMGKSESIYQFAKSINMPVVERRISQMTEGDFLGLPSIDGDSTKWNPPDWLKSACDNAVVLFFDEVDRGIQEVRQALFELTDSRKINGWHLHEDTLIFAAVNGGTHGSQYQVGEMDPAELDRWTVFDLEPSVDDWLTYAKDKVNEVVWDFVNHNRVHLEHKGEYEPNKVYPSRRSWFRFNECITTAELLGEEMKSNLPIMYEIGCGFIGMEASVAFRDFVQKYESQVTVEDIFNGKMEKTKSWGINEHIAMIDKIIASEMLKTEIGQKEITNLANYGMQMPAEATMKLWKLIGAQNVKNAVNFHKHTSAHLVSIMAGATNKK